MVNRRQRLTYIWQANAHDITLNAVVFAKQRLALFVRGNNSFDLGNHDFLKNFTPIGTGFSFAFIQDTNEVIGRQKSGRGQGQQLCNRL